MQALIENKEITAFTVDGEIYRVVGSDHAIDQMRKRGLDKYHIAGACLSLGRKLFLYNNSGKQIFIVDDAKNLACLIAVEKLTVVIITVIGKSAIFIKENTVVEDVRMALA